jgi:hypothetical protein
VCYGLNHLGGCGYCRSSLQGWQPDQEKKGSLDENGERDVSAERVQRICHFTVALSVCADKPATTMIARVLRRGGDAAMSGST